MPGSFVIIGGREDRDGERGILLRVAARARKGSIVVITAASAEYSEELSEVYQRAFTDLGAKAVTPLRLLTREDAMSKQSADLIDKADAVFFSGGDQLRLTSQLGNTPTLEAVQRLYDRGGVVAGTSAGASAIGDTMVIPAEAALSSAGGHAIRTARGFGLMRGIIIDQHFSERGRLGRLLAAVAQNPKLLGLGIDEDTAVLAEGDLLTAIGKGGVYVLDGSSVTFSTIADAEDYEHLSVHDLKIHLLAPGHVFNLAERRPSRQAPTAKMIAEAESNILNPPKRARKKSRGSTKKRRN